MKKYLSAIMSAFLFLQPFSGVSYAKTANQNKTSKKPSKSVSVTKKKDIDESKIDYKKLIKNLDKKQVWKMVIDGRYHKGGKYICDKGGLVHEGMKPAGREPGYLKAMLGAFKYMVSTIDKKKIDENLFREFHKRALTKVGIRYKFDCTDYWGDKKEHASFPVAKTNSTEKGKKELFEKKKDGWECEKKLKPVIRTVSNKPGNRLFAHESKTPKESKDFAKLTFETYYKKLEELKENGKVEGSWIPEDSSKEDKTLEIIIRICQCLDQAHTFYDGNIRTIVFLTMNKMLVENGLSPVCMWNPNCLDVIDVETLIGMIKDGQDAFRKIFVKPNERLK